LTNEEWISKAISVHGTRYNYSRVDYQGADTEVTIGCEIHGWFDQLPRVHANLRGNCQSCMKIQSSLKRTFTTAQFIVNAKKSHGEKYDYSRTIYKKAKEKLIIGCRNCSKWFSQTADTHTSKSRKPSGCPDCNRKHKLDRDYSYLEGPRISQNDFIIKCKSKWGNRIDYSETIFKGTQKMMTVRCIPCDNIYPILANNHVRGNYGCQICRYERTGDSSRKSTIDYIIEARSKHGLDFDYSEVEYTGKEEPIIVTCNTCNTTFNPQANVHLSGKGSCPGCRYVKSAESTMIPMDKVIEMCNEVHQGKYEYPWNVENYKGMKGNMPIICKKHGTFSQTPSHHYHRAQGCSKCLKKTQTKLFYFIKEIFSDSEVIYDYKHPDLRFKKSNRPMEIDIWISEKKLAIEYQGEQHFMEHWSTKYSNRGPQLKNNQGRDEEKRIACKANGIRLIEIDYTWDQEKDSVEKLLEQKD
jgi:protein-arginine kinase activator protein McsA